MITYLGVFNVWPKTSRLLPVWPRGARRSDALRRGELGPVPLPVLSYLQVFASL